jgi:hypothetical protein
MPQAYEMLSNSTIEPEATKGRTVYKCAKHDYGCASDDTRITGVQHISLSLTSDGDYPFFTHPLKLLKPL